MTEHSTSDIAYEYEDAADDDLNFPLHRAIRKGDLVEISRLLDTGSDINTRDNYGRTPLHCAVQRNNPEIVRYLMAYGADPDLSCVAGSQVCEWYDAAMLAALSNSTAVMQELITHGVQFQSSVLGCAAAAGHFDMVQLLFENPTVQFSENSREEALAKTLLVACRSWSVEMVQYFMGKLGFLKPLAERGIGRQSTLNLALLGVFDREGIHEDLQNPPIKLELDWNSATQIVKLVVGAGAQVNTLKPTLECTPLHFALQQSTLPVELIEFLLVSGADVNVTSWSGRTVFFDLLAHPNATVELIERFKKVGGVMNVTDGRGNTPLHCVQNLSVAQVLLRSGADPAATNNHGDAPLHVASMDGCTEIMLELLNAGASINQRAFSGWTALMQSSSVEVSKILLQHGADVNAATDLGWTALHEFSEKCNLGQTNLLLSHGADVHALATQERRTWNPGPTWTGPLVSDLTPLHVAVHIKDAVLPEILAALLDHGANIEAKDSSGKTPLLLAIATDGIGAPIESLVNCLLERGANMQAVDGQGRNGVQLADSRQYRINEEGKFERKAGHDPRGPYVHAYRGGRDGIMYL